MAGSQTTIALVAIQRELEAMLTGQTPADFPRYAPGSAFNGLASQNRASTEVIRDARNNCQTLKIYHQKQSVETEATVASSAPSLSCTISAGDYPVTLETSYTPNLFATKTQSVNDNICGQFFANPSADGDVRAARLVADQIVLGMRSLRNELDKEISRRLNTNRQTANYASSLLPYMVWDDTNDVWDLPYNLFQTPDTFTGIQAMMANNGIGEYFMLGGINTFYNAFENSVYRQLNDNERFLARFGQQRIAFDIFNMDAVLNTADNTGSETKGYMFAIADGSYAMVNFSDYMTTPERIEQHEKPTWRFSVADPFLRINENGVLRPVMYDVHYQTACNSSDSKGHYTFLHHFQMQFKGFLGMAPTDTAGRTGIMKFTTTPGV